MVGAAGILLLPVLRKNEITLAAACVFLFAGTWIDKGMGMISGGFVPSPLHHVTEYSPSLHELAVSAGVTALGLFILTLLYKIVISVKVFNQSGRI
jgi:molybdopterin-containing oxidoreductase family membrane subunit